MGSNVRLDTHKLQALRADLEPRAQELLNKVTFDVEQSAKDRAPVRTGFLKNSGSSVIGRLKNIVQFTAEYALFVELGARSRAAHPFLVPALEQHRKSFNAAWKQLIKR